MEMMRIVVSVVILAAALTTQPAQAHDFWKDGQKVDPVTKSACCGEKDCYVVPPSLTRVLSTGYWLIDTRELIPWSRVQPSPDGNIWRCRWIAETMCFFAPFDRS
jgi:hypothetical protein